VQSRAKRGEDGKDRIKNNRKPLREVIRMADESFNLDSLLEDLDEAVRTSPKDEGLSPHTVKFVPHPPPFDRPHHPSTVRLLAVPRLPLLWFSH